MDDEGSSANPLGRTYTVQQLAEYLQVERSTALRNARSGEWPCLKLGARTYRFTEEHVARILAKFEVKPAVPRQRRTRHGI